MNFFERPFLLLTLSTVLLISACSEKKKAENPRELTQEEQHIEAAITGATFENIDGSTVSYEDFKGKVVLFDFWETWCGPCLQVFPLMDSLKNEYPNDFVVVAVNLNNSDTPEDVQNFKDSKDYDFVYTIDNNNIGDEIITLGIPFKVFFDPEGYLIKAELGLSGEDFQTTKEIVEQNKTS